MALLMPGFVSRLQAQAPQTPQTKDVRRPAFAAVSVKINKSGDGPGVMGTKPGGRFVGTNVPLGMLLDLLITWDPSSESADRPGLIRSASILRRNPGGDFSAADLRSMEQAMLADRFGLIVHHETRQIPVYALVVLKAGALAPADGTRNASPGQPGTPPAGSQTAAVCLAVRRRATSAFIMRDEVFRWAICCGCWAVFWIALS